MTISLDQITEWMNEPSESATLEFKEAKEGFKRGILLRYCVAIANEGGGHLVLGITDKKPREVVGSLAFPNLDKIKHVIFSSLGFWVDAFEVKHPDGRVVVFKIPGRPSGTAYDYEGVLLMRSGEHLVKMSQDRMRAIYSEEPPDFFNEAIMEGLDEQRVTELLDTQVFYSRQELPHPIYREEVLEELVSAGLVERSGALFSIRRIGALLFAKRLSDFEGLSYYAPRVTAYNGIYEEESRMDRLGTKGYVAGFTELVELVMEYLPQTEIVNDASGESAKFVPEVAVRELIGNALIHQDFTTRWVHPRINIFSDRIEISNPGAPILETDRFISEYQTRNPQLTDLMRLVNICEESGTGFDKVIAAVEASQLPAPMIKIEARRVKVVIYGAKGFKKMDMSERMHACFQHCVLRRMRQSWMTNESLRKRFGLPDSEDSAVDEVIAETVKAEIVKLDTRAESSKKHARYVPYWENLI